MGLIITDGKGKGFDAGVSDKNRLRTDAVTESIASERARLGTSFDIDTGLVNLTSGGESAILFIKNDDATRFLQFQVFITGLGKSNITTLDAVRRLYRNPTGGTIVSAGTNLTPRNRNFGSALPTTGTYKKGAEGSTITGGDGVFSTLPTQPGTVVQVQTEIVMPTGASIAFTIQPPAGNTGMNVSFVLIWTYGNLVNIND